MIFRQITSPCFVQSTINNHKKLHSVTLPDITCKQIWSVSNKETLQISVLNTCWQVISGGEPWTKPVHLRQPSCTLFVLTLFCAPVTDVSWDLYTKSNHRLCWIILVKQRRTDYRVDQRHHEGYITCLFDPIKTSPNNPTEKSAWVLLWSRAVVPKVDARTLLWVTKP